MTRDVSRLFTDYLPTEVGYAKHASSFDGSLSMDSSKHQMNSTISGNVVDMPATDALRTATQGTKSRRIFVARIPSCVSEEDMRKHFEEFGAIEDAYRPRDFAKNTFRGIGFVTFADADAVDRVIGMKHTLGGADIVVDRATPKEISSGKTELSTTETVRQTKQTESNEGTVRPYPSVEAMANNYTPTSLLGSNNNDPSFDWSFFSCVPTSAAYPNSNGNNYGPPSNYSDEFPADLAMPQTGFGAHVYDSNSAAVRGTSTIALNKNGAAGATTESTAKLVKNYGTSSCARPGTSPTAKNEKSQKTMTDNFAHVHKVRGGPRIFVGKLSKDTVEQDLADYFSQFGFVMDIYIPRSRESKKEHRGFGFVTFETEASIKRAISQGTHNLKGAVLAIDVAVPENAPGN